MLKFKPNGTALSLQMMRLFRTIEDEGLMASIVITDGKEVETHISLDPPWSCCHASRQGKGATDTVIEARTWKSAYDSHTTRDRAIDRTITGLALTFEAVQEQIAWLTTVMVSIQNARKFANYGEEWQGRTDPPAPDKVPESIQEAVDIIHGCLTEEQIAWAKQNRLYDAMPQIGESFGARLVQKWCSANPSLLTKHIRETHGLFGHLDDTFILTLTYLWGVIQGDNPEKIAASVSAEVSGMAEYWQKEGVNPATGERSIIV